MRDFQPIQVKVSASFPQLVPAAKNTIINDELRRTVIERIDIECTGPFAGDQSPSLGEISDDCEVPFRTRELVTISCRVAWSGEAMGAHPDGNIENTTYRIATAKPLQPADLLRQESLDAVEQRIRASLARDYSEELKDPDPEWVSDVVKSLLRSPFLTKQGVSFEYATRWHDFVVIVPYPEARAFLQPSIMRRLAK